MELLEELYNYYYKDTDIQICNDRIKELEAKVRQVLEQETYTFTKDQLEFMLKGTIELYLEYQANHTQEVATAFTAFEVIKGLDADKQLSKLMNTERTLQL